MSNNTSEQIIENQLQSAVKALDNCDLAVKEKVAALLREKAKVIRDEQRRLIEKRTPNLARFIEVGELTVKSSVGSYKISVGYSTEAIKEAFEGLIMEFGRPGKTSDGVDKNGKPIGRVEATPHIRQGFDNVIGKVADELRDELFNFVEEKLKW